MQSSGSCPESRKAKHYSDSWKMFQSHVLVLTGDFNHSDIYQETNTVQQKQSRSFQKHVAFPFTSHPKKVAVSQLRRCSTTYKELIRGVVIANLCCCEIHMEEFKILRKDRETNRTRKTPDSRRTEKNVGIYDHLATPPSPRRLQAASKPFLGT